jgi:hypothetical protein
MERRGQWVAYAGAQQLGFGATAEALEQECVRRAMLTP